MTYEEAERKVRSENCILPSAIIKDKEDDPNAPIIFYTEEEMAAMKSEQMGEATWQAIIREMERNEAEEKAAQCIPAPTNTAQNEKLSSVPSAIIKDKEDDPNAPIIFYTEEEMAAMKSEQMGEATWQAIIREMERNETEEKVVQCTSAPTNMAQNETFSSVPAEPDTHMSVIPAPTAAVPHPPTPPVSVNTTPLRHVMSAIRKKEAAGIAEKREPYDIAQDFMRSAPMRVYGESIYFYTGKYYKKMSDAEVKRKIIEVCRMDVGRSGSSKCLADILNFIRYEPTLLWEPGNDDQRYISFENGVLNIDTGTLNSHDSIYFTTYHISCRYYYDGPAPSVFETFLRSVIGGDDALVQRIYEMIGYILAPDNHAKVLFLLQGCANSGKSVLSALIRRMFDEDAVSDMDIHELSERFAASDLEGKALCISPDLPSEPLDAKSVSKLKRFTGNDIVSADVKYKDRVKFQCKAKFLLATNHPLLTRGSDEAFLKRVVVIPFCYSVPKEQQDFHLLERLDAERGAIVSKAIRAYFQLRNQHYRFSGSYRLNAVYSLQQQTAANASVELTIYEYLHVSYEAQEGAVVFLEDAYAEFIQRYCGCSIAMPVFSKIMIQYAEETYGAQQARKRKSSGGNPISCLIGLKRRVIENNDIL